LVKGSHNPSLKRARDTDLYFISTEVLSCTMHSALQTRPWPLVKSLQLVEIWPYSEERKKRSI